MDYMVHCPQCPKGKTKKINLRGSKILILSSQSRFCCPSDLSFLFYIWRHLKLNVKLKNLLGVNFSSN